MNALQLLHLVMAAAEPQQPAFAPGLATLARRFTSSRAQAMDNTRQVQDRRIAVWSCVFHAGQPGIRIGVTDDANHVYWTFHVRALPKYMVLRFQGIGRRDRLRPDDSPGGHDNPVARGNLGPVDMPAEKILTQAIAVALAYVRKHENNPEYMSLVQGAAEPKSALTPWAAVVAALKTPATHSFTVRGRTMIVSAHHNPDRLLSSMESPVGRCELSVDESMLPTPKATLRLRIEKTVHAKHANISGLTSTSINVAGLSTSGLSRRVLAEMFRISVAALTPTTETTSDR